MFNYYVEDRYNFIINNKYIQSNPNEYKSFIKKLFNRNSLFFYNNKMKNIEEFILKMDDELQKFFLSELGISFHKELMLKLIKTKNKILYPITEEEYEKTKKILKNIKIIPVESFIQEDILFLFKHKIESVDENLIEKLLEEPYLIIRNLNSLSDGKQKELLSELTKEHIYARPNLADFIDKETLFRITKTMNFEELESLKLSPKKATECFINNIKENLYLIGFVDEETVKTYFYEIKESLYTGTLIGKQGLKYFVIKNRKKIDKRFAEFVLKKYPKFYNSLKLNFEVQCGGARSNSEFNLKKLIFKKELTVEDKEFLKQNIEKIMFMKLRDNFNKFTLNLIKEELNK